MRGFCHKIALLFGHLFVTLCNVIRSSLFLADILTLSADVGGA